MNEKIDLDDNDRPGTPIYSNELSFNYNKIIENQDVPPLPSNQQPPMYAKLHWTNHIQKLKDFSENIKLICKEEKLMKSNNSTHLVSQRFLKSLKEYNFELYPEYTIEEKQIFFPHAF